MADVGHRLVPHTARFEAWAPSRDQCLAEAVLALIEGSADTSHATATAETQIWIDSADDDDQLARLLGERFDPEAVLTAVQRGAGSPSSQSGNVLPCARTM